MALLYRTQAISLKSSTSILTAKNDIGSSLRYASSLKETKNRIKSIRAIQKITKTMKMIASARLKAAQNRMEESRPFSEATTSTLKNIQGLKKEGPGVKNFYIVLSTDRGLCGAINSQIARSVKARVDDSIDPTARLAILGEKVSGTLTRTHGKFISMTVSDLSKGGNNFFSVSIIVDKLLQINPDVDNFYILYNKFNSVISFTPTALHVPSRQVLAKKVEEGMAELDDYEFEDDFKVEHLADLGEYHLAASVYNAMLENQASELGARMTSMDTATTNAGDMIKRLTILYNRGRQAAITTELNEIISGAESLKDSNTGKRTKVTISPAALKEALKYLKKA